jgi:HPt (histidine-containing phosphotransfer) domain-containing protein
MNRDSPTRPPTPETAEQTPAPHRPGLGSLVVDDSDIRPPAAELPGIDLADGLRRWGRLDTYRDYLERFVVSHAGAGLECTALCRDNDRTALAALAHKIKGAGSNLGLPRVVACARQLEARATAGDHLSDAGADLQAALDEVAASLAAWPHPQDTAAGSRPADTAHPAPDLSRTLGELLEACTSHDPAAADAVLARLHGQVDRARLAAIQAQVDDFDFRAASQLTHDLLNELTP